MCVRYKTISIRSDVLVAPIMEALGHMDREKWDKLTELVITSSKLNVVLTDGLLQEIAKQTVSLKSLTLCEGKTEIGGEPKLNITKEGIVSSLNVWRELKAFDVFNTEFGQDLLDALNADLGIKQRTDLRLTYRLRG